MSDTNTTGPEFSSSPQPGPGGDGRGPRRGGFVLGAVLIALAVLGIVHHFGWHAAAWHAMGWHGPAWQAAGWHGVGFGGHWWALFLLIPGVSLLVGAIRRYRGLGEADGRVIGRAVGGVVLTGFALKLFFGFGGLFGGHVFWPLVLVVGVLLLTRRAWRHRMS